VIEQGPGKGRKSPRNRGIPDVQLMQRSEVWADVGKCESDVGRCYESLRLRKVTSPYVYVRLTRSCSEIAPIFSSKNLTQTS
jgi:hypothetical protein